MGFRLHNNEPLDAGLARLFHQQLQLATGLLEDRRHDRQDAVHEVRKAFKRMRAMLRLIKRDLEHTAERENARLRDLSALLSPYRDADAMLESIELLHQEMPEDFDRKAFDAAHTALSEARDRLLARPPGFDSVREQVLEGLHSMRHDLGERPFEQIQTGHIAATLQRSHRRACKAAGQAIDSGETERFHTWRKRVKDLLYQGQMLAASPFGPNKKHVASLSELAETLGRHHDLAVFEELAQQQTVFPDRDKAAQLQRHILKAREALERQAGERGRPLMDLPSNEFFS